MGTIIGLAGFAGVVVFGVLYVLFFFKGASLKLPIIGMAAFFLLVVAVGALTFLGIGPFGSGTAEESEGPPDLTGKWKQADSEAGDSYQEAAITDGTIEIYWVSDGGNTKSLYWAGTYEAPASTEEPYSWDSENDHDKTDAALLAPEDDYKTFTYEKGKISYEVSALGITTTITLEKQ